MNQIQKYKEAVRLLQINCTDCNRRDECLHTNNPISLATRPRTTIGLEDGEISSGRLSCRRTS